MNLDTFLNGSLTFLNDRDESWKALDENLGRLLIIEEDHSDFLATWKQVTDAIASLSQIERYWACPGERAFTKLTETIRRKEVGQAHLTVQKIRKKLDRQAHRKKHFEVIRVAPRSASQQKSDRRLLREIKANGFDCEFVYVPTAEDALNATLLNTSIQSVVIHDDAPLRSRDCHQDRLQQVVDELAVAGYEAARLERGQLLARQIANLRPELLTYLVTDSQVENIAARQGETFKRIFLRGEDEGELIRAIMLGVEQRYEAPFYNAVVKYARRPISNFHALPISRGKSLKKSNWVEDYEQLAGASLKLESSAITGGLDSLLEPTGPLKAAQEAAARIFGAKRAFIVTNGTTGANKIVTQALLMRGDVVLTDRNCHKSIHSALMEAGASVCYLPAYKLNDYSIYGAVPLRELKRTLLQYKRAGEIDRVRLIALTNRTFDGTVYDPTKVMMECLAIAPRVSFLWDEAWSAFAAFHPLYRSRTAMQGAKNLEAMFADPDYPARVKAFEDVFGAEDWQDDERVLNTPLLADPKKVRFRVYATQSMHKTMTALRQVSVILIHDQDYDHERFINAYHAHTTTSPNYSLLISADIGRRLADLDGYKFGQQLLENSVLLRQALNSPLLKKWYPVVNCVPEEFRESSADDYFEKTTGSKLEKDWQTDEFVQDPSRITLDISSTGLSGEAFKQELMEHNIQVNKTSVNTLLFQVTTGTTRSDASNLIQVLRKIALNCEEKMRNSSKFEREVHEKKVRSLTPRQPLPDVPPFHPAFRVNVQTPEGDVSRAQSLGYDHASCEYFSLEEAERLIAEGRTLVSAKMVVPYPPGSPVLVPGEEIMPAVVQYLLALDVKEVHGLTKKGLRVFTEKALAEELRLREARAYR
ncbi:aminotransferase class I/II-fold pyridoxal phosphate-dependent enzyme [Rhizobium hidalgonense]|uniref:aminotransferase class I/II-fold pyridoxal phosphate-dependent enzyme n=1 Tax=Rhizobium hidalgonense TaxID=1538159 RepID=UPI000FEC7F82|nr:aminotransferase class I/II-fold pyridoxal phosphate-dependent enzyme [Rhizobium hidalgonense]RWX08423.1 aminotransferase class I/II-fold pyridoxal phosphate-dependent enzyme [Rhizobium hidalgonense]